MKIAVVSDDHLTISAHFGRALYYEVFTLESGKVTARETLSRSNTIIAAPGHQAGEHHHDHNAMIAPIADCHAILTRGMGNGAYLSLQEHGILPVITDITEIQTALEAYQNGTLINHTERLH